MTLTTLQRFALDLQTFLHGADDLARQPHRGEPWEDIPTIRRRHVRDLKTRRTFTEAEQRLLDGYVDDTLSWADMLTIKTWICGNED